MAKVNRVLVTDTYVTDRETGQSEVFAAGTPQGDIPKNFLEQINNDSVWGNTGNDEEEDDVVVEDYASMSQKELLDKVKERELDPASTKKDDLIDALEQHDQAAVSSTAQVDVTLQ